MHPLLPAATEWREFIPPADGQPTDPGFMEVALWRLWHHEPEHGSDAFIDLGQVEWDKRSERYLVRARTYGHYPIGDGVRWARIIPAPLPVPETLTGIFVDTLMHHGWIIHRRAIPNSHLFCSDPELLDNLHALAERIGLKRRWFQHGESDLGSRGRMPHYDCTPSRHAAAIEAGAVELSRAQTSPIIRKWRALHATRTSEAAAVKLLARLRQIESHEKEA